MSVGGLLTSQFGKPAGLSGLPTLHYLFETVKTAMDDRRVTMSRLRPRSGQDFHFGFVRNIVMEPSFLPPSSEFCGQRTFWTIAD